MKTGFALALLASLSLKECDAIEGRHSSGVTQKSELHKDGVAFLPQSKTLADGSVLRHRGGAAGATLKSPPKTVRTPWPKSSTATDNRQATKEAVNSFLTRESRNTFIARVYAILAGQLLVTAASVYVFGKYDWAGRWMSAPGTFGAAVPGISLVLSTVAWYIMFVSPTAKRSSPLKWQILALFTLGEAVSVGFLTSFFKFESVLTSFLTTAYSTIGVSAYTVANRNSKYDLSTWGATLSQAGLIFLGLGLIQLLEILHVLPKGFLPLHDKVLSFAGATLFSFYLAHHTRTIVSGKYTKHEMDEKDYVYGAMTLYNDIINIFVYILKILGDERDH